jgi:hypothetical protein
MAILQNDIANLTNEVENGRRFSFNSSVVTGASLIQPLRNQEGVLPENFPATRNEIGRLQDDQCDYLLNFYGLHPIVGNQLADTQQKIANISNYLGIR